MRTAGRRPAATFRLVAPPKEVSRADASLVDRDRAAVASAQKLRFFPLAPVRGRGARLVEADGRELIDLSGSWSAAGLGHAHPAVVEAVTRAVAEMPGASALSLINAEAVGLAEELIATLPDSEGHVAYIGLSGSDANAAALRCVRAATGRDTVIAFEGSYHGGLGPGRDVSGLLAADGPAVPETVLVPYPGSADHADSVEAVARALAAGDVAAVIVEPVMSDGGVRIHRAHPAARHHPRRDRRSARRARSSAVGRRGGPHLRFRDRGVRRLVSSVAARAVAFLAGTRLGGAVPFPELTDREREVLDQVARGLDSAGR